MAIILTLLYIIIIIIVYILIIKRLKFLNDKHIAQTWVKYLSFRYKYLFRSITILFVILIVLSSFIILMF